MGMRMRLMMMMMMMMMILTSAHASFSSLGLFAFVLTLTLALSFSSLSFPFAVVSLCSSRMADRPSAGDPDENSSAPWGFARQLTFTESFLNQPVRGLSCLLPSSFSLLSVPISFPACHLIASHRISSHHTVHHTPSPTSTLATMDSAPNLSTSPGSMGSNASLEIADALFCEHGQEVCTSCGFDAREENDVFFGFSPIAERGALTLVDFTRSTKDNSIHCKKHGTVDCKQCFNWKKNIAKLQKDASKAQKKKPKNTSNFE